ncbi:hypothetical protein SLA2020_235000 [Shorea laevis]
MDFSPSLTGPAQMLQKQSDDDSFAAKSHPSFRRTLSFSSSSSFSSCSSHGSSYYPDDSPLSPSTPLHFSGVPFSWEHVPGIPKKHQHHKKNESIKLFPLVPPPATASTLKKYNSEDPTSRKKYFSEASFRKDPFFAALVKCSKDQDDQESGNLWTGAKLSRSLSDRFGFINLYASCKSTCDVTESIAYLPKSRRTPSYNYGIISHRRSRLM